MIQSLAIPALLLCIIIPFSIFFKNAKKNNSERKKFFKRALFGNIISFFSVLILSSVAMFSSIATAAETAAGSVAADSVTGMAFIAAALSTGLGSIAAGIATGSAASSALGALSENENIMGKALIFVALAEGIAIYGLVISFMILNRV